MVCDGIEAKTLQSRKCFSHCIGSIKGLIHRKYSFCHGKTLIGITLNVDSTLYVARWIWTWPLTFYKYCIFSFFL